MTTYLTKFHSYWGNAIQGIWIEWEPTGHSPPAVTTTNVKMNMHFDIRMYATGYKGIESDNGNNSNWGTAALANQKVLFYMLI